MEADILHMPSSDLCLSEVLWKLPKVYTQSVTDRPKGMAMRLRHLQMMRQSPMHTLRGTGTQRTFFPLLRRTVSLVTCSPLDGAELPCSHTCISGASSHACCVGRLGHCIQLDRFHWKRLLIARKQLLPAGRCGVDRRYASLPNCTSLQSSAPAGRHRQYASFRL